jgi:hypothetical protein
MPPSVRLSRDAIVRKAGIMNISLRPPPWHPRDQHAISRDGKVVGVERDQGFVALAPSS